MSLISQRFVVYFAERLGDKCTNGDVAIGGGDGVGGGETMEDDGAAESLINTRVSERVVVGVRA